MHFHYKAFAFKSSVKLSAMKDKLNTLGPWEWIDRDNDRFGDYLSSQITPDSMAKLYEHEPGEFQMDVKFRSTAAEADAKKQASEVHERFEKTLLPALGATAITPTDPED